jgi:hypothetical protein
LIRMKLDRKKLTKWKNQKALPKPKRKQSNKLRQLLMRLESFRTLRKFYNPQRQTSRSAQKNLKKTMTKTATLT